MINTLRNKIISFLQSKKNFPALAAIAAGLYPLAFYYYRNFTLINSTSQFFYFLVYFLVIPILVFKIADWKCNRFSIFKPAKKFALPFLNFSWSLYLLIHVSIGFNLKIICIAVLLVFFATFFLYKYFHKIIVFQFLLAIVIFLSFLKVFVLNMKKPETWLAQPDTIDEVVFKKKPNIYIIQPDGYANAAELKKGYYSFDNSKFESYLGKNNFKTYRNFRSNYYSTLSSNASLFGMKHHYHNKPKSRIVELYNARDVIVGENPVLKILKNNNYKTHLLLEKSYLLYNRPDIYYDNCNISLKEIPYFPKWESGKKEILQDLKIIMSKNSDFNNFYFLEKMLPSHITNKKNFDETAQAEREKYLTKLKEANVWLKEVIDFILVNDKNCLIVIVADHGGFVGMNTILESRMKLEDRDLIYSIFTSKLAIKWPEEPPVFDGKIKTPVNLFRILFSYLSENELYLQYLQENKSYIQIEKGAPFGVYEHINEKGNIVFKELSK